MLSLSVEGSDVILAFRSLFSKKIFAHVQVLIKGVILCVGRHTVCAALRFAGLGRQPGFQKYHRLLSRVKWSTLQSAKILLHLLLSCFTSHEEPLVFGIDETIERRQGAKIKAKGIYRDPVRSSHTHFVKCSGLRWITMMLLCQVSWAERIWALPFFTALAPSERYCNQACKRHKKLTDWARQMILQLSRWLPERLVVIVADSSYAVLELLRAVKEKVSFITRLRLDAALYDAAPQRPAGKRGRSRLKGKRQPTLKQRLQDNTTVWQTLKIAQWYNEKDKKVKVTTGTSVWYHSGMTPVIIRWVLIKDEEDKKEPVALLCTNAVLETEQIIAYFIRRWSMEVTFEESRAHLGVETQRQWSDKAIERSTPCLMGLFSLTALWADRLQKQQKLTTERTAWYQKEKPTFSDAIAAVRSNIWQDDYFYTSMQKNDMVKIPKQLLDQLTRLLAAAA